MISFTLNSEKVDYEGDETLSLLNYLRQIRGITSVKDGCSGQAACGACMVELDGKPALSCSIKMNKVNGKAVITIEGIPERARLILARAFVAKGAVQCGFCTPGLLSRANILLENNPNPSREDVIKALNANVCRCTGYVKIIDAILLAANTLKENSEIPWEKKTGIGYSTPKHEGYEKALGVSPFINDMNFKGMLYGALKFSDHPRARVLGIDVSAVEIIHGVIRIFTAKDIPGQRHQGLVEKDWPMMVEQGEITRYIGDVLAGVVAETEELARHAVESIVVEYEILEPLTELAHAPESPIKVHEEGNLLKKTIIQRGYPVDQIFERSACIVEGHFETPFVDHAFLETEASIALPDDHGEVIVYSQNQGIFSDRTQIASVLGISEDKVNVIQISSGGAFGGKEDLTVQHHAALYSTILNRPVKVRLNRAESIRMHPKRHRTLMNYKLACDSKGLITALHARILGDTGAYASVGGEVVARIGTHAAGAYHIPNVDIEASAYYTNNIPAGAFRGFGVNQATFAMESMVDELCSMGGFDRWRFRYDNALDTGRMTSTGQV
ncbi:molybdopterin cofactor-binding domain-containing protein, partial [Thermodesulfobacteriota bacterium]